MAMRSTNQKSFKSIEGDRYKKPRAILHRESYIVITTIVVDI
jgi:hypothetical protein